jgi:hypothetical protein
VCSAVKKCNSRAIFAMQETEIEVGLQKVFQKTKKKGLSRRFGDFRLSVRFRIGV